MSLLANSNAIEDAGYKIQRSLRFRSSASAYLSKTWGTAPTSTSVGTFSAWVKRGKLGAFQTIIRTDTATTSTIQFESTDQLTFQTSASNAVSNTVKTTQVFRDPSAWYHIVWSINNSTGVWNIYINGIQITSFATNSPSSGGAAIQFLGNGNTTKIAGTGGDYFDGYLAEVNFIDGQALTPSSFGQTDAVTGVWTPKKYTGTYGTNGFYLNFSDNTSATTLAYDKSGNGNNWTANNISTTAGATYDSMTDVPTLTSATAANFAVLNPLSKGGNTLIDGNLYVNTVSATSEPCISTIGMSSGKWYCETSWAATTGQSAMFGVTSNPSQSGDVGSTTGGYAYYSFNGNKYNNGTGSAYGATYGVGDVIGIAFDADNGTLAFYKNGVSQGTAFTSIPVGTYYFAISDSSSGSVGLWANFGQRPFSYTPPTGFKALNTFNLD